MYSSTLDLYHQWTHQPINQLTDQPTDQPTNLPINQPTSQLTNQLTDQPIYQPRDQPTHQPLLIIAKSFMYMIVFWSQSVHLVFPHMQTYKIIIHVWTETNFVL